MSSRIDLLLLLQDVIVGMREIATMDRWIDIPRSSLLPEGSSGYAMLRNGI
jgi:hypothetical protein